MNRDITAAIVFVISVVSASADDWGGVPTLPDTIFRFSNPRCEDLLGVAVAYPPCPPGTSLQMGSFYGGVTINMPLPTEISSPESGAYVTVLGVSADSTSPSGYVSLQASVSLSAFARADTVSQLQSQVGDINGQLNALQTQVNSLATTTSVSALQAQVNTLASASSVSVLQTKMNALATSITSLNARMAALDSYATAINQIDQRVEDIKRRSDENSVMAAALSPMTPSDGKSNRLGFNGAMTADQSAVALNYTHVSDNVDLSAGVAISGDSAMARAGVGISW